MNIFETIFLSLGGYLIGYFTTKYLVKHLFRFKDESLLTTDINEDDEFLKSVNEYVDKYYDDWKLMSDETSLTQEEKEKLKELYVTEDTPRGKVIMCYDIHDDMYYYWTDRKDNVLYTTLDTVAQKYALTYQCKDIYHDTRLQDEEDEENEEFSEKAKEKENDIESDSESVSETGSEEEIESDENNDNKIVEEEKSVFARFKSYNQSRPMDLNHRRFENKDNEKNTDEETDKINDDNKNTSDINVNVKNRFHYKGTLYDWEQLIHPRIVYKSEPKQIDYASFKKGELRSP